MHRPCVMVDVQGIWASASEEEQTSGAKPPDFPSDYCSMFLPATGSSSDASCQAKEKDANKTC